MPLQITIPDASLVGLSQPAQQELASRVDQFATDLISEANRLEAGGRTATAVPDVNAQMVREAAGYVRRGLTAPPTPLRARLVRAMAAALALISGLIWDKDSLTNSTYLIVFGAFLAVTLVLNTVVVLKD